MKKITRLALILLILNLSLVIAYSQVGINSDNSDPDQSAMLDVKSTDKGMLIPRMDSTTRNAILNPAVGLLVYDSTTTTFWYYDEMQWNEIRNGSQILTAKDIGGREDTCLEQVGNLSIGEVPDKIDIAGNYVYVAERGSEMLRVVDISNPKVPVSVGNLSLNNRPQDLVVSENYVFLISDSGDPGIESIDISDPNNPTFVDSLILPSSDPYNLAVSGNYAYIADIGSDDIKIIDVSDPNNLNFIGSLDLGMEDFPSSVEAAGNYLYIVGTDLYELIIVDVSDPLNPIIVSTTFIDNGLEALVLAGNYVYVVGGNIKTVDISDPLNPIITDSLDFSGFSDEVVVSDNYAYVNVFPSDVLLVIDISNPTQAILKSSISIGGALNGVAAADGYAYLTNGQFDDLRIVSFCETILGVDGASGALVQTPSSEIDNQKLDVFQLSGNNLQISLEDDNEATQSVDLSTFKRILTDTDEDTRVQVEESADEDIIRFDLGGEEKLILQKNGSNIAQIAFPNNNDNIFIGVDAGLNASANDIGVNTVVGNLAGRSITSGNGNSALGYLTLSEVTTGSSNVAIGQQALQRGNTTGNVALGYWALRPIGAPVVGDYNTVIGYQAGRGFTGDNSVLLGRNAGYGASGDNKLFIDNSDTASPLIYGEFDNDLIRINGDLEVTGSFPDTDDQTLSFDGTNLSIADGNSVNISSVDTDTDNQTLSFDGTNLSIADGNSVDISSIDTDTDDQTLSFDGTNLSIADGNSVDISGVDTDTDNQTLSFDGTNLSIADGNSVNLSSINSIQSIIEDADGDTEIQVEESADEDIIRLNIGNQEALKISKNASSYSLFQVNSDVDTRATQFGLEAGINQIGTESNNSFFGYQAGKATTSGTFNTALGSKSLSANTIGERNVGIGGALAFNIDGDDNVAIGVNALGGNSMGNENVGIGVFTGFDNETGSNNVFIGYEAGRAFSPLPENVSDNVIIGHGAGQGNQGSGNVYIGKSVGLNSQSSNRLAIDNSDTNSPLLYGEFDNDLVRINGELNIKNEYSLPETDGTDGQVLTTDGAGNASWGNSGVPVGSMMMWMTDTPPTGWVICNGQDITAFPKLVAVLGSNNVPDLRDRFPFGSGNLFDLDETGGQQAVTLTEANIPPHTHDSGTLKTTYQYKSNNSSAGSASNKDGSDVQFYNGDAITGNTGSYGGLNGSTKAFNILPPFRALNFIIKVE